MECLIILAISSLRQVLAIQTPSLNEINIFRDNLAGSLSEIIGNNSQHSKLVVLSKSAKDVQNTILFASDHDMQVSVRNILIHHTINESHTRNPEIAIDLSQMNKVTIKSDANTKMPASMTFENGCTWQEIRDTLQVLSLYKNYTMEHILSLENVLEYYMIDYDGHMTHIENAQLFHPDSKHVPAGIIVNMTIKLETISDIGNNRRRLAHLQDTTAGIPLFALVCNMYDFA